MTRQSGYYWVKHESGFAWEIGFFFEYNKTWQLMGASRVKIDESDIYQINEARILAPDEVSDE